MKSTKFVLEFCGLIPVSLQLSAASTSPENVWRHRGVKSGKLGSFKCLVLNLAFGLDMTKRKPK